MLAAALLQEALPVTRYWTVYPTAPFTAVHCKLADVELMPEAFKPEGMPQGGAAVVKFAAAENALRLPLPQSVCTCH